MALAIEMALLNCTQVIAAITPQTPGSAWVPYEYGRVKDPVPESPQAACWVDPRVANLPESLYLGPFLKSEIDIVAWLHLERSRMGFTRRPTCSWPRPMPKPL